MSPSALSSQPLIIRKLVENGDMEERALAEVRERLPEGMAVNQDILVEQGVVSGETIARRYAEHLGTTWYSLGGPEEDELYEISVEGDRCLRGSLSELARSVGDTEDELLIRVCREHRILPVLERDGQLHLACHDPADFGAVEEVRLIASRPVVAHPATPELLEKLAGVVFGGRDSVRDIVLESGDDPNCQCGREDIDVDVQRALPSGKDSQVLRIVNTILAQAVRDGASDIHLEPYESTVRVRYRIDGHLVPVTPPPQALFTQAISRLKILAKMDIAERRVPQDGAIALKDGDKRVDLRVSTVPTVYGEKMVLRILSKNAIPTSMEPLGFSERQAADFLEAANSHHGLMFVTGPTGSGKSTTLYTCLNLINQPDKNIVTVEDPVEYKFEGLNQVPVRSGAGMTFASALRAFLRQDPDVIMVGEVRDQETAQICMRAALTGHLVLSTLHTNSALQVVTRLVDMGIEPFLLGPALKLIEAQRLVRRLCTECKEPYSLPEDVAGRHGLEAGVELYRGGKVENCPKCRGTGYKGRVGIYEVISVDEELAQMVARRASEAEMEKKVLADGRDLLPQCARQKLLEGLTSLEEVSDYIRV